jgi:hypothetical protein
VRKLRHSAFYAVAADFYAHHQDRRLSDLQASQYLVGTGASRCDILMRHREGIDDGAWRSRKVTRYLNIDWKRPIEAGPQNARDRPRSRDRVIKHRLIAGDLLEDPQLRLMGADLVMDEKPAQALRARRCCGQHDDRRSLGIGARDGIDEIEGTRSVGGGRNADSAAHAGGSVSRKSHGWFVTQCVKGQNAAALDDREQRQGKVAGNAEYGPCSMIPQRRQKPRSERISVI